MVYYSPAFRQVVEMRIWRGLYHTYCNIFCTMRRCKLTL